MGKIQIPTNKVITYIKKNFEYKERRNGEEYIICNPFNGDSGFHFNINPEKGVCHDWRGDEWAGKPNSKTGKRSCNILRFISLYEKCTISEAIKILLDGETLNIDTNERRTFDEQEVELPNNKKLIENQEDELAKILISWLQRRSYTLDDIEKYDLRYFGTDVIWPYYEFDILVYWQSRSYLNKKFRFPSPNVFDKGGEKIAEVKAKKGEFLYGFDDIEVSNYIIITEAIFDKYTLGEQTLASGGAALTSEQLTKIRLLNPKNGIILAPDSDKAGLTSILQNFALLKSLDYPLYFALPDDMGDDKTDWNKLFETYKMSKKQIRAMFDKNIKKLTTSSIVKLSDVINMKNRIVR